MGATELETIVVPRREFRYARLTIICIAIIVSVFFIGRLFPHRLGHDQTSYLVEAERFLDGNELYGSHLSETNPPLIIWFSSVAVLLSRLTHLSGAVSLKLIVLLMLVGSVGWCIRIFRHGSLTNAISSYLCGVGVLLACDGIGFYEFGQREHLLILLLLPYLIVTATEVSAKTSRTERIVLGSAAGIALWFKPHDVLIVVALECFFVLQQQNIRRLFRPETVSMVLMSTCLLICVLGFTPAYFKAIFGLLNDVYWALGTNSTLGTALSQKVYIVVLLLGGLLYVAVRKSLQDPRGSLALLICSFAASIAADIQHTLWRYHLYPQNALLIIALTYLLVDWLSPLINRAESHTEVMRIGAALSSVFTLVLISLAVARPYLLGMTRHDAREDEEVIFSRLPPGTTVSAISPSVSAIAGSYDAHQVWGSRFAHLWMLPAIMQNELGPTGPPAPFKRLSPKRTAQLATLLRTQVAEDLNYWHPSIVLIQHCDLKVSCQGFPGKSVDLAAWFERDPQFAAAWSHYHRTAVFEVWDVYSLAPEK